MGIQEIRISFFSRFSDHREHTDFQGAESAHEDMPSEFPELRCCMKHVIEFHVCNKPAPPIGQCLDIFL